MWGKRLTAPTSFNFAMSVAMLTFFEQFFEEAHSLLLAV